MSDLVIDPTTGDLQILNGDLSLTSGIDGIAQNIRIRLNFFLGEWFLDTSQGMPYFQNVLVKQPNSQAIRAIFRKAILTTPGVLSVTNLELDLDNSLRKLSVSFQAETTDGTLVFEQDFVI